MKLSTRDAAAYFAKPDPRRAGLLIFGDDAARVALRRSETVRNLAGERAEEDMRLTRIAGSDLRRDPAALADAIKATGFFPGVRVAVVDGATDALAPVFASALADWREGDAVTVATAGPLRANSKLRKLFEGDPNLLAAAIYDDPPDRHEIERLTQAAGLSAVPSDAMAALVELANSLEPGDFRQMIEKIGLYKLGDDTPLAPEEIALSAPATLTAALDDALDLVADGRAERIAPLVRRLQAQGVNPVSLTIGATRRFRLLHQIAADPGGPGEGIKKVRPPVWGARRTALQRQASRWPLARLEAALALLLDTDLALRSSASVPEAALIERALLRIAWMNRP